MTEINTSVANLQHAKSKLADTLWPVEMWLLGFLLEPEGEQALIDIHGKPPIVLHEIYWEECGQYMDADEIRALDKPRGRREFMRITINQVRRDLEEAMSKPHFRALWERLKQWTTMWGMSSSGRRASVTDIEKKLISSAEFMVTDDSWVMRHWPPKKVLDRRGRRRLYERGELDDYRSLVATFCYLSITRPDKRLLPKPKANSPLFRLLGIDPRQELSPQELVALFDRIGGMLGFPGLAGPDRIEYATKVLALFLGREMGLHRGRQYKGQPVHEVTFADVEPDPWVFQEFPETIAHLNLEIALEVLLPSQRVAFQLAVDAAGEYGRLRELAEQRGLNPKTVYSNLCHAREKLKRLFSD